MESGCGSVGRAVNSNSGGLRFESSHQHNSNLLFTVNRIETSKIKKKEAGNDPLKKNNTKSSGHRKFLLYNFYIKLQPCKGAKCLPKYHYRVQFMVSHLKTARHEIAYFNL